MVMLWHWQLDFQASQQLFPALQSFRASLVHHSSSNGLLVKQPLLQSALIKFVVLKLLFVIIPSLIFFFMLSYVDFVCSSTDFNHHTRATVVSSRICNPQVCSFLFDAPHSNNHHFLFTGTCTCSSVMRSGSHHKLLNFQVMFWL